jgi:hypothetical protein
VHYVDLGDDDGSGLFVHEWIVSIDGADIEAGCDDEDSVFVESGEAVFMKDPVPGDSWTSLPPLQKGRTEANAVVGLSGEMMVFGGYGHNAAGDVVPRLKPELFRPSFEPDFLFGPAVASTAWEELCPMSNPHTYHSVAGLLRDGRVVVAGGAYCGNVFEDSGAHSVELFSPPALFGGPRPRIDNVLFGGQTHQEVTELPYTLNPTTTFTIEALLQGGIAGEFRVALTRPASVTHAFDNNQRYVVLKVNVATSFMTPPASWTLAVHLPTESQRDAVPPGYYLLTVVNAAGRPASAKWIRMLP